MKSIDHYITYSVITAQPQLTYSSVLSTIRCFPITSGRHEGQSFVQWTAHFSSDADAGMLSSLCPPLYFIRHSLHDVEQD